MKSKMFLLLMLTFLMYSMVGFAQKKEYKVEDDGYEWYEITKTVNEFNKHGAQDRNGNIVVPVEYDCVIYDHRIGHGFSAYMEKFCSWYNKSGKCIIPYTRGYKDITKWPNGEKWCGTYYEVSNDHYAAICDRNGREVVKVMYKGISSIWPDGIHEGEENAIYYIRFHTEYEKYKGIADANGKIVVPPGDYDNSALDELAKTHVTTTRNPLAGNTIETEEEAEGRTTGGLAGQQQQQQSGGQTTVVVEHHRDPIPVQEWQQCTNCWGAGKLVCDRCVGRGTIYIGDNLKICHYCNGHGEKRCPFCAGKGGQYVTVYR